MVELSDVPTARREPIPASTTTHPHHTGPMANTTYRVECHDGSRWTLGVRLNPNRLPEICRLTSADTFRTRADANALRALANRLCGGTLRVAVVRDAAA